MNKTFLLFIAIFVSITFYSCGRSDDPDLNISESDETIDKKLDYDVINLSASDAEIVAKLFTKYNHATRSITNNIIKNIVPIEDSKGNVVIYAVNFLDGYILISASTNYYPILAQVDHGTFSLEEIQLIGESVLIDEISNIVSHMSQQPLDWKYRSLWNKYIDSNYNKINCSKTRATDDYWAELDYLLGMAESQEMSVRLLKDCKNSLPPELYSKYYHIAESEDRWHDTEYSWENTAYVLEYETPETTYPPVPCLSTIWDQGFPYNTSNYNYLGCVTIAVGQLMRYYRIPYSFNWDAMPDNTSSPVLCDFLKNLRDELRITPDGTGTNERALEVLKNYGYDCYLSNHNIAKLMSSLLTNNKPVYAYGADLRDSRNKTAHAWVIDGCSNTDRYIKYSLYVLSPRQYPDFEYETADDCAEDIYFVQNGVTLFHMNWGWGGRHNGWFSDSNMSNPVGSYSSNRKEIFFN